MAAWQWVLMSPGIATRPVASITSRACGCVPVLGPMVVICWPVMVMVVLGANTAPRASVPTRAVTPTMARSASGGLIGVGSGALIAPTLVPSRRASSGCWSRVRNRR